MSFVVLASAFLGMGCDHVQRNSIDLVVHQASCSGRALHQNIMGVEASA